MSSTKNHSKKESIDNTPNLTFSLAEKNKQRQVEEDQGRINSMFYSQCFLSSKGPFGNIWVAGYFFKRLKKRQVTDTDIPSSVDKILLEGLPSVTYRFLAYLLLGVVRIYSKKVEYLYQDCDQIVSDINKFSLSKKAIPFRNIVRSTYSISLPERYELDAFQLEVADTAGRDHTSRKEDIISRDSEKDTGQCSLDQHRSDEASLHLEELDNTHTSEGVTELQKICRATQTPEKVATDQETTTPAHTPPDNVLPSPHLTGVIMEVSSPNRVKNVETSKEKLRGLRFTQDEGMDIDMICEVDDELLNLINDYKVLDTADGEEEIQRAPLENREHVMQEDIGLQKAPLDKLDHVMQENIEVLSSSEQVHGPEIADLTATPVFDVVPTPAKKGNLQRPSKRKCLFDMNTMLDNEAMKHSIKDASALVCKRRRVPCTAIDIWRFDSAPVLLKNLTEPLIHRPAMEIENIHCREKTEVQPSVTAVAEPAETTQGPEKLQVGVPPMTPPDGPMAIAPETPVRCPTSARVFGSAGAADSDVEGAQSFGNLNEVFVREEEVLGPRLMDVTDAAEGDSQEIHKNKNGWSGRTRTVATYLYKVCQKKHKEGKEAVPLLPILKRKPKGESARFFYEILVLSSGGFINVTQQKAYEDVLVQETSKLEATLLNS